MNARHTWIGAFGVVLAGAAAFYWSRAERTGASATPNASTKSERAAEAEQHLVGGVPAAPAESDRTLANNAALDAAHAPETAKDAHEHPTAPVPTQQPLGDVWSTDTGASPSALDPDNPPDPDGFATKYAGLDTVQLQSTLAAVEAVIAWQHEGKFEDKSQALPLEAMQALEREQQWLKAHAYP
jgi:hypothetical protein